MSNLLGAEDTAANKTDRATAPWLLHSREGREALDKHTDESPLQ